MHLVIGVDAIFNVNGYKLSMINVTPHVVRLKGFRLKAEGIKKARLMHFGGNKADSRTKHAFPVNGIFDKTRRNPVFPNPAFGRTFSLTTS